MELMYSARSGCWINSEIRLGWYHGRKIGEEENKEFLATWGVSLSRRTSENVDVGEL